MKCHASMALACKPLQQSASIQPLWLLLMVLLLPSLAEGFHWGRDDHPRSDLGRSERSSPDLLQVAATEDSGPTMADLLAKARVGAASTASVAAPGAMAAPGAIAPTMSDLLAQDGGSVAPATREERQPADDEEAEEFQQVVAMTHAALEQAWAALKSAQRYGPHQHHQKAGGPHSVVDALWAMLDSAATIDWYFLAVVLFILTVMDLAVLQQLPETARAHFVLLCFWLLVAGAFCIEVWVRMGPQAGVAWMTGYVLEIIYSLDTVLVVHVIFCALETPRRLMAKALFAGIISAILFRFLFALGLASALDGLGVVPGLLGIALTICGVRQLAAREDDCVDVTQTMLVRGSRFLLGDRLGEFYDEEGEGLLAVSKGQVRVTLLGVVIFSLVTVNFAFAFDVVLTKAEELPNAYIDFSSSALALFAVRAFFFAARDLLGRCRVVNHGIGLALIFMGVETLLSHSIYVNALSRAWCQLALSDWPHQSRPCGTPGPKLHPHEASGSLCFCWLLQKQQQPLWRRWRWQ